MFQPAVGYKALLASKLARDDTILPLSAGDIARLAEALPNEGDYTRLWLGDGVAHEVVKATGLIDGAVAIDRGEEGTQPTALPAGTCVSFAWTPQNLADFIQQGLGGIEPAVCGVQAGSSRVSVTANDCNVTVDVPACAGASWRAGNLQYTQDDAGCIVTAPVSTPLVDGAYVNATVTVRDGQIVAIQSGTNIVYSGGGCCPPETP
jgi:hypothetical protein